MHSPRGRKWQAVPLAQHARLAWSRARSACHRVGDSATLRLTRAPPNHCWGHFFCDFLLAKQRVTALARHARWWHRNSFTRPFDKLQGERGDCGHGARSAPAAASPNSGPIPLHYVALPRHAAYASCKTRSWRAVLRLGWRAFWWRRCWVPGMLWARLQRLVVATAVIDGRTTSLQRLCGVAERFAVWAQKPAVHGGAGAAFDPVIRRTLSPPGLFSARRRAPCVLA